MLHTLLRKEEQQREGGRKSFLLLLPHFPHLFQPLEVNPKEYFSHIRFYTKNKSNTSPCFPRLRLSIRLAKFFSDFTPGSFLSLREAARQEGPFSLPLLPLPQLISVFKENRPARRRIPPQNDEYLEYLMTRLEEGEKGWRRMLFVLLKEKIEKSRKTFPFSREFGRE